MDSNGGIPTFGDMDNDGDLDLFVGTIGNTKMRYFENTGISDNSGGSTSSSTDGPITGGRRRLSITPSYVEKIGAANPMNAFNNLSSSKQPVLVDMDADGDLDMFVSAGINIRYYENTGTPTNPVFFERVGSSNPAQHITSTGTYLQSSLVDIDADGDLDMFVLEDLPASDSIYHPVHFYRNEGSPELPVFSPRRSNTTNPMNKIVGKSAPTFYDMDNDGDYDLFIGLGGSLSGHSHPSVRSVKYYENTGSPTNPLFTARENTANPMYGVDIGLWSAPVLADIDNDGDADMFVSTGINDLWYFENTADITVTTPPYNVFNIKGLDVPTNRARSAPTLGDINNDGLIDLFVGDADGTVSYFKNTGTLSQPAFTEMTGTDNPMNGVDVGANSVPALGRINEDLLLDLFVGGEDGKIHFYLNTGTLAQPIFIEKIGAENPMNDVNVAGTIPGNAAPGLGDLDGGNVTCTNIPFNGNVNATGVTNETNSLYLLITILTDGDLDLFVGRVGTNTGSTGSIKYYTNNLPLPSGTQVWTFTGPTGGGLTAGNYGINPSTALYDIDGDGDLDLLRGDKRGYLVYHNNTGSKSNAEFVFANRFYLGVKTLFEERPPPYSIKFGEPASTRDMYSKPAMADMNNDGVPDIIVGDIDGNIMFMDSRICTKDFSCTVRGSCKTEDIIVGSDQPPLSCKCNAEWSGNQCSNCPSGKLQQHLLTVAMVYCSSNCNYFLIVFISLLFSFICFQAHSNTHSLAGLG